MSDHVTRAQDRDAFLVTRELPGDRIARYLIDAIMIREAARQRPNRDVMGNVIPWSRNMIEHECLRIARPALDRMIADEARLANRWNATYHTGSVPIAAD